MTTPESCLRESKAGRGRGVGGVGLRAAYGYSGEVLTAEAESRLRLGLVKQWKAKRGIVLMVLRWVVERGFA